MDKEKVIKRHYQGSFSVEAALIMPLTLGVIILSLYLGIFSHDKMVMEYSLIKAGSVCNEYIMDEKYERENLKNQLEEIVEESIESSLIGKWNREFAITDGDEFLVTEISGKMNNSQGFVKELVDNNVFGLKEVCKVNLINECKWIRKR